MQQLKSSGNQLVSVIIPVRNRATLIIDTLHSVANQTYRPLEIIVVDDYSTDNTTGIVSEWGKQKQRPNLTLSLSMNRGNPGASQSRNTGLAISRGHYIQFLDSDDLLHPDKLTKQVATLKDSNNDFVWSSSIRFKEAPDWSQPATIGFGLNSKSMESTIISFIQKGLWRTESGLYLRSLCESIGGWQPLAMFQDWEYHIRMICSGATIQHVPGTFSAARQHDMGRIGDKWSEEDGLRGAIEAVMMAAEHSYYRCGKEASWFEAIEQRIVEIIGQTEKQNFLGLKKYTQDKLIEFHNRYPSKKLPIK